MQFASLLLLGNERAWPVDVTGSGGRCWGECRRTCLFDFEATAAGSAVHARDASRGAMVPLTFARVTQNSLFIRAPTLAHDRLYFNSRSDYSFQAGWLADFSSFVQRRN